MEQKKFGRKTAFTLLSFIKCCFQNIDWKKVAIDSYIYLEIICLILKKGMKIWVSKLYSFLLIKCVFISPYFACIIFRSRNNRISFIIILAWEYLILMALQNLDVFTCLDVPKSGGLIKTSWQYFSSLRIKDCFRYLSFMTL